MSNVKVYTTQICPECKNVKSIFTSEGIEFEEVDFSSIDTLVELRSRGVFVLSAPLVEWNGKIFELFEGDYREATSDGLSKPVSLKKLVQMIKEGN